MLPESPSGTPQPPSVSVNRQFENTKLGEEQTLVGSEG